jgi:hypothetical protein
MVEKYLIIDMLFWLLREVVNSGLIKKLKQLLSFSFRLDAENLYFFLLRLFCGLSFGLEIFCYISDSNIMRLKMVAPSFTFSFFSPSLSR